MHKLLHDDTRRASLRRYMQAYMDMEAQWPRQATGGHDLDDAIHTGPQQVRSGCQSVITSNSISSDTRQYGIKGRTIKISK